jgi:hypothetical protein
MSLAEIQPHSLLDSGQEHAGMTGTNVELNKLNVAYIPHHSSNIPHLAFPIHHSSFIIPVLI